LLALGGEVVVDYDLRAKSEYPKTKLIVAGYSNDVMGYIPSKRVLGEGGYEAVDSMVYYGMPGPFADDVEERVFSAIHRVMSRVGIK
jgi:neutral ceramidase